MRVAVDPRFLRALESAVQAALAPLGASPALAVAGGAGWTTAAWTTAVCSTTASTPRAAAATVGRPPAGDPVQTRDDEAYLLRVQALVQLAQAGDAEAFGQLYELNVDQVFRYVYYRVGSRSIAEDLTSETFLRGLRRLDSFTWTGRDIAAWFITIARNLVLDHVKSARYRLEITTDELLDAAETAGTEQLVLDRIRDRTLLDAMARLRPEQQECLVLRFFQELSLAETAQVLGRTEGAVKQLQLRAVRALAQLVTSEGQP